MLQFIYLPVNDNEFRACPMGVTDLGFGNKNAYLFVCPDDDLQDPVADRRRTKKCAIEIIPRYPFSPRANAAFGNFRRSLPDGYDVYGAVCPIRELVTF